MLFMSIVMLAAAPQVDTGDWGLEFDGKECLAGRIDKQGGLVFAQSAGGNLHFFTFGAGSPQDTLYKDYTIELIFGGKSVGTFTAEGAMMDPLYAGYAKFGYSAYLPLTRFADKDRIGTAELRLDGRTIVTFPLNGLNAAINELGKCNREAAVEKARQAN